MPVSMIPLGQQPIRYMVHFDCMLESNGVASEVFNLVRRGNAVQQNIKSVQTG